MQAAALAKLPDLNTERQRWGGTGTCPQPSHTQQGLISWDL